MADPGTIRLILRVVFDALLLFFTFLPVIILRAVGKPFTRGFFCNDESISYPHHGDTVSVVALALVGLFAPIAMFIINEVLIFFLKKRGSENNTPLKIGRFTIHPVVITLYKTIGVFLFGGAANQTATDIMKYSIGRLRPHFLSVCQPDYSKFSCTDARGVYQYIEGFTCTGTASENTLKQARLSHPSGHASSAMYFAVFFVLYVQTKFHWNLNRLLKPFLQIVALYLAFATLTSRISDYKHHWSDVLGGGLLGTTVALLVVIFVSDFVELSQVKRLWEQVKALRDTILTGHSTSDVTRNIPEFNKREGEVTVNIEPHNDLPDSTRLSIQ